jgi:hypothetical protein
MYESDDIAAQDNPRVAPESDEKLQIDLDLATPDDRGKQMHAIPRCCSLEGLTELSPSLQGIELATLVTFDTIVVRTVNSDYRMFMLDPETGRGLLEGGKITEPVEARVLGSSFGGSVLRTGWIGVGLRIEALAKEKYIRTSPVQSLFVEHETSAQLASNMYL